MLFSIKISLSTFRFLFTVTTLQRSQLGKTFLNCSPVFSLALSALDGATMNYEALICTRGKAVRFSSTQHTQPFVSQCQRCRFVEYNVLSYTESSRAAQAPGVADRTPPAAAAAAAAYTIACLLACLVCVVIFDQTLCGVQYLE